jgi:trigger factor
MASGDEKPSVRVTSEEVSPVVRSLGVEVDAARVGRAFDRAYRELARKVRVRGFRPGKTPRSVLERLYGASVAEEVERALVGETLPEAVAEAQVTPVAEPSVDATPPAPDAPFQYRALIEVKPQLELPALKGLAGSRPSAAVGEDDVLTELENLRNRRGELKDAPEGTPATQGSFVTIDYEGRIDDKIFEGGSAEGAVLELGSGRFIPGFEEQLEGVRAGEQREIEVEFPADYASADVAGKRARFAVSVTAVRVRKLPELDDAFAKELGDFETLADLRARLRSDLEAHRERAARAELRRTLLDWILARTHFEVPPGLVDRRLDQRLAMAHRQLSGSVPDEALHSQLETWREEWRPSALRDVQEELVLEAVAAAEGLGADDEELDAHIESQARERGMAPARLRERYAEAGLREGLRFELTAEKALDHLVSVAKVEESSGT